MPVYLMPFLTIQNSSRSRHGRICVARSGGGGSMLRAIGLIGTPGAP